MSGRLDVRFGPMRSGKSTWLCNKITRYHDKGYFCIHINYTGDNRSDDHFSLHSSGTFKLCDKIKTAKVWKLEEVDVSDYNVIGVEEAQFFPDLLVMVEKWLGLHKIILVAGLDGDVHKKKFGQVLDIIPLSHSAKKITSECLDCAGDLGFEVPAPFTISKRPLKGEIEIGKDVYVSVCAKHYLYYKEQWESK